MAWLYCKHCRESLKQPTDMEVLSGDTYDCPNCFTVVDHHGDRAEAISNVFGRIDALEEQMKNLLNKEPSE